MTLHHRMLDGLILFWLDINPAATQPHLKHTKGRYTRRNWL
jgi:hypothetical protein